MEVSALQEIQSAERSTQDLHTGVSRQLEQGGYRGVTPQSVNPDDQSPFHNIQGRIGDTTHVVESTFEEIMGGTSDATRVRTTEGTVPISIVAQRGHKKGLLAKLGLPKQLWK